MDNIDHAYIKEMLDAMYGYLSHNGELYYIACQIKMLDGVALYNGNELAIVVCKDYQRPIGRKVPAKMPGLAKEKGLPSAKAGIYAFNTQSQRIFASLGFQKIEEEIYSIELQ